VCPVYLSNAIIRYTSIHITIIHITTIRTGPVSSAAGKPYLYLPRPDLSPSPPYDINIIYWTSSYEWSKIMEVSIREECIREAGDNHAED